MKRMLSALALVSLLFAAPAFAEDEEHGIGKIVTEDLDLSYIDHVLAGRVGDRTVYGMPLTGEFGLRLMHRAEGADFETEFRKVGDEFVSTVGSMNTDGEASEVEFRVNEINGSEGWIKGTLGDKVFSVQVTSDEMNGHHFVEPHFEINVDGVEYSFDLEGGQACMGCVTKLSFAIITMLNAYGVL